MSSRITSPVVLPVLLLAAWYTAGAALAAHIASDPAAPWPPPPASASLDHSTIHAQTTAADAQPRGGVPGPCCAGEQCFFIPPDDCLNNGWLPADDCAQCAAVVPCCFPGGICRNAFPQDCVAPAFAVTLCLGDNNGNGMDDACEPICGNAVCDDGENPCNCPPDCGPVRGELPGTGTCGDLIDNDCDGFTDCQERSCQPDCPVPQPDPWTTWRNDPEPGQTFADFSADPIPMEFFGPGSDPFTGRVEFKGNPLNPGLSDADTLVLRAANPVFPSDPPGANGVVPIEIVALSLVSIEPIVVTSNGGQNPQLWDVRVDLSELPQQQGFLNAQKTHPNGGNFNSMLPVLPRFTFTRVRPCPHACGDLNGSGGPVDLQDFAAFAECFGLPASTPGCACADLDGDGSVALPDFATFAARFGLTSNCSPPECGPGCSTPEKTFDTGLAGHPPKQFQASGPFVNNAAGHLGVVIDPNAQFVPGIQQPNPGDPASQHVVVVVEDAFPQARHTVCLPEPLKTCAPGCDYLRTIECGGAMNAINFADNPIPAGFFGDGSDALTGFVPLVGVPIDPDNLADTDTIMCRLDEMSFPTVPSASSTSLVVSALSLASAAPVTVTYAGGGSPELWDLRVGLSEVPAPPGTLRAVKTHRNGGTFESTFSVQPLFTFTRLSDGLVRVFDSGLAGAPPTTFGQSEPPDPCPGPVPWAQNLPAGSGFLTDNPCFVPGVDNTVFRTGVPFPWWHFPFGAPGKGDMRCTAHGVEAVKTF